MAPPGKPFAGRYAEATDGTIMPGAMAGGSKPMAGAERIKELLGAADKTWDQLKEEWDKRQGSSGTGSGNQSSGGSDSPAPKLDNNISYDEKLNRYHTDRNGDTTFIYPNRGTVNNPKYDTPSRTPK